MRERHNMKTLSALSRKAHSNVLSLAAAPATRSLTPGGGSAASGRQDFRWVLVSAGFARKRPGVREAPIRERNGRGRREPESVPGCIPSEIDDGSESVNETERAERARANAFEKRALRMPSVSSALVDSPLSGSIRR